MCNFNEIRCNKDACQMQFRLNLDLIHTYEIKMQFRYHLDVSRCDLNEIHMQHRSNFDANYMQLG